jgi:hypothetical protein
MNRFRIAVLRILDQEHHEECYNSGAGVNDQLPRIRVMKGGAGYDPDNDYGAGRAERPRCAESPGGSLSDDTENILNPTKEAPLVRFLPVLSVVSLICDSYPLIACRV